MNLNHIKDITFCEDISNINSAYILYDLKYEAEISYIPSSVSNILYPNDEAELLANDYLCELKNIATGSTYFNDYFNSFKFKYATNFSFFFVNLSSSLDYTKVFIAQRIKANARKYQIIYDNHKYPVTPIDNVSDMYSQMKKGWMSNHSSLSEQTYATNADLHTTVTDVVNDEGPLPPSLSLFKKWIGCIPLRKYYNSKQNYLNGLDISEHDLQLQMYFEDVAINTYPETISQHPIEENLVLMAFCEFDCIYVIKDGRIIISK